MLLQPKTQNSIPWSWSKAKFSITEIHYNIIGFLPCARNLKSPDCWKIAIKLEKSLFPIFCNHRNCLFFNTKMSIESFQLLPEESVMELFISDLHPNPDILKTLPTFINMDSSRYLC